MKVRQSGQICLNPKLLIRIILENGYEVNLMWKTNSLRVQNNNILHFFFEILIDEIKNTSMKARKSLETGLNLKFVLGGFLSNYLVNESECYEQFKMAFSIFLQIFKWRN